MYTVIVVDDEEEIRKAIIRKIKWEEIGFRVIGEAENGIEALTLAEGLEPDLLLSDIRMPFLSGIELARKMREIRPTMQIAFLSGYDDFTYAQQAIQYNIISYILKPISAVDLTNELQEIKKKIDSKFEAFTSQSMAKELKGYKNTMEISSFLMPLLLDGFLKVRNQKIEERLLESAISCGLIPKENLAWIYTVMVTSIRDAEGKNCTTSSSINGIDTILRKYIKYFSFFAGGRVISFLMASQSRMEKYLHILVEDIAQSVKRIMGLYCAIGVSRPVKKLYGCHEAYVEAMNAMSYSQGEQRGGVYFIADEERNANFDQEIVQEAMTEISDRIRSGSKTELEAYLYGFFAEIQAKRIQGNEINFMMVQLVSVVFQIVYAVAGKPAIQKLHLQSFLQGRDFLEGSSEVGNKYIKLCLEVQELISRQRKKSSEVLCDKALELIQTKYMEPDLSLVTISSEISVSPNYLSALIKKTTGSTFSDLLTNRRIEKAKELLLSTAMKVREISEKCGYNDQHYFSYCFKKVVGVSPNYCRRQNEETTSFK